MTPQPNDGGPAFPIANTYYQNGEIEFGANGMSLRTHIAISAMQGLIGTAFDQAARNRVQPKRAAQDLVDACCVVADMMIEALETKSTTP